MIESSSNQELASLLKRFLGAVIDSFIMIVISIAIVFLTRPLRAGIQGNELPLEHKILLTIFSILSFAIIHGYFLNKYLV